jgi:tetratricopeptide (TPR) repeat protein
LTSARLTEADVYRSREQYDRAAVIQQGEERRLLALPAEVRGAMDFDYQSGRPAAMLGDSLYYLGRYDEALAAYHRAVQRFEHGLQETPHHRKLLEALLVGYWSISGTLNDSGRAKDALIPAEQAVVIGERLL